MVHSSDVPKEDSRSQHDRFIETARKLGCDEDRMRFDEKLQVIATHKPAHKSGSGNISFDKKVLVPRETLPEIKKRRDAGKWEGRLIIEDTGGTTVTIECERATDAMLLKLTYGGVT